MKLSGNVILITGGSSGIGLALAKRFCAVGNKVIITGRDFQKLENVQKELPEVEIYSCELTDEVGLQNLIEFIRAKHPNLNMLINNAAIQYNYHFVDGLDLVSKIDYEINTNLAAPIKLTTLLLPLLLGNENPAIINVSSGLMIAPKKTASVYCATKAAIHSFSKTLRYQLENTPVKVFEIIPPLVETPMTEGRGKAKISAEELVEEFLIDFESNKFESYIGKAKLLKFVSRVLPKLADKIMKNGL